MEHERLTTFYLTPIDESKWKSIANSPIKFAEAGLERSPDSGDTDEVFCRHCGFKFRNWDGEKPASVHRAICPNCPFLNQPAEEATTDCHVRGRRQLFSPPPSEPSTGAREPDDRSDQRLHTRHLVVRLPYKPIGGFAMLFAGIRVLTFTPLNLLLEKCRVWAENGFIFRKESADIQCVYCGVVTSLYETLNQRPQSIHETLNPRCPFINHIDVGNVTVKEEQHSRQKYHSQATETFQNEIPDVRWSTSVKFKEYASAENREKSFKDHKWPCMLDGIVTPEQMSSAGFFYTGSGDAVRCFYCGMSLFNWKEGAIPLIQHALHSPKCNFMREILGEEAIRRSSDTEALTEAVPLGQSPGESMNVILAREGVCSDEIDSAAFNAAQEAGYSFDKICKTLLGFLQCFRGYPSPEALLAALKADHELNNTLREQEQIIQRKDQEKAQAVQEKEVEKQQLIQDKESIIQDKESIIQDKESIIQDKESIIQDKESIIQELLMEKERQARLIKNLAQQLNTLQSGDNASVPGEASNTLDDSENPNLAEAYLCKLCCDAKADVAFLPCGHFLCCQLCVERLSERQRCPYCRDDVRDTHKIYAV